MITNVNKNILWIDYAKFIGIFLVVFGHVLQSFILLNETFYLKRLWEFIYLFHMPLFFIISWYLYIKKDNNEEFKKIIYGLLIPYFLYQLLFFPFVFFNKIFMHDEGVISAFIKCFTGILLGDFYDTSFSYSVSGPCWFIISIIQLRLLFSFIKLTKVNILLMFILSSLIFKLLFYFKIDLLFCLDNTIMAIPYFIFGFLLKQSKVINAFQTNKQKYMNAILCFFSIVCLLLLHNLFLHFNFVQMNVKILPEKDYANIIFFWVYIAGILGSMMIFFISVLFKSIPNFIQKISRNTLFIIFFHFLICFFIRWGKIYKIMNILQDNTLKLLFVICFSLLILLISYYAILFLEKYYPILLGKYQSIKRSDYVYKKLH